MTSREIATGEAEQILCDGWPVELVVYDEPWSIVRDTAGTYRALTRTLRPARGAAHGRTLTGPRRGITAQDVSALGSDPCGDLTAVFAFRKDHLPIDADDQ